MILNVTNWKKICTEEKCFLSLWNVVSFSVITSDISSSLLILSSTVFIHLLNSSTFEKIFSSILYFCKFLFFLFLFFVFAMFFSSHIFLILPSNFCGFFSFVFLSFASLKILYIALLYSVSDSSSILSSQV